MPAKPNLKHMGSKAVNSIPGQIEAKLDRAAAVWRRRCEGASMPTLAREFDLSIGTIHNYIEDARALLREETGDLAARERAQALALLDTAIEQILPHVRGEIRIETVTPQGHKITVDEWQARIQACGALTKLLDRKSKLLGMDAPIKVEPPPVVAPESAEQRARAREALKTWCRFSVDPKDFQGKDLS